MSIIRCDYLDDLPKEPPFPRDLAALIVRKADSMARHFEAQATEQLTKAARSAWRRGMSAEEIAHQLGL